jgi:transcriptional regulator with GAF, ATPase, and Fis domain
MKVINLDDFSGSSRATLLLQIAQLLIDTQQYEDGMDYSLAVIKSSHTQSREYALACILRKICSYMIEKSSSIDITTEIDILKKMGCMYDYILAQRARIVAEMESDIKMVNIRKTADDLQNMYVAAQSINAYREIQQIEKIRAHLFPAVIDEYSKQSISAKYLTTFSRLADLIHEHLGDEDFVHNVLDVIIESTHAERGALFMKTGAGSMKFMVGRNMDQTSIEGAHELSLTALKEMKNDNLILTDNALDDPELSTKKSVVINQIRSLLCIALSVGSHVVGALYLDSRLGSGHFGPEDKAFLLTVSKILASVIEKSKFFHGLAEENILLKAKMIEEIGAGYVLGRSQQIKKIYQLVDNVAPANLPVLIQGETGTGKGMLARLIHQKSQRKEKKFLTINCGAIPETLLESELFGHKKGAFTGAMYDKKGLLEEGEGGTVFLDEVANTSPAFQAKLLEAIEEKKIRRLGETMTRSIDVRFFFATNRDLEHETKEGRFRKDLYYRVNVFKIELPPLRERKKDIPELAQFFLERFSHELNKPIKGFSPNAIQSIQEHKWPGNVRELQNAIERAVVLTQNDYVMAEDFGAQGSMVKDVYGAGSIDETKKKVILEALNRHKWNVKKTAQELGIGRVTLWRFMKKHGISRT